MTLEELKKESYKDLPITNVENIDQESFYNQEIKAKWLDYKSRFELLLARSKGDYQVLYREKWEYYGGKSDVKIYVSKPFNLKVLKTDLQIYISSDDDIIELSNKIAYLETTIKFIDGVIKSIDNRGWDIKHAISWKQFEAGMI
jgi:hypothetical protein|tara:strand:- start:1149 stop:1580 length:432 start_codon:yes stop_codon:yes gene_type:complete